MPARHLKTPAASGSPSSPAELSALAGKKQVLVVDDHPLVRYGISLLLNRQKDLACSQDEVDTVAGIIPALLKARPELLLLDLNLKDGNSLDSIGLVHEQFPNLPIIVMSQSSSSRCAEEAMQAGAAGYVTKEEATREILTAIRTVLRKETYLGHKLEAPAVDQPDTPAPQRPDRAGHLAAGELQMFILLGTGVPPAGLAKQMKISAKTLKTFGQSLLEKLNLPDETALIEYARKCRHCFEINSLDPDAALFHCALQLECCERGILPRPQSPPPNPPSSSP